MKPAHGAAGTDRVIDDLAPANASRSSRGSPLPSTAGDVATARRAMVESQLRPSGVNDRLVLTRMLQVAREDFVPEHARAIAYIDRALPLGPGPGPGPGGEQRFLPAPTVQGLMLQEAAPQIADRVLVVDAGSGYLAELLAPLVASLTRAVPEAAARGEVEGGPFTLLLIDGAIEHVPPTLAGLLVEGGRCVTGLVERGVTRLAAGRRVGEELALLPLAELGIPALAAFARPRGFTF